MKFIRARVALFVFVIFIIGFCIGTGIKIFYELKTFKPYAWNGDPPIILNCYGPDFSELQMIRAIDYWTVRGHNIGFYEHNPPPSVCEESNLWGFIILRKAPRSMLDDGTLASTSRKTTGIIIRSVDIYYSPGSFNLDLINEHELGHAFGYSHLVEEGHIMHPHFSQMGGDFWVP